MSTNIDVSSLEPNSYKYRAEKANKEIPKNGREKIAPVIDRSKVVSTKKPLGKKISETFMTEDAKDVKTWLLMDVLIPGIKSTILDILSMMFFGETNYRGSSRKSSSSGRVDYRSKYQSSSERTTRRRRNERYDSDDQVDFRNIIIRNREDAEDIIEEMRKRIRDVNSVSIADLLDLIDVPGRYTDNNWGWDDEMDVGIRRVSSGYLIDVAEPKYIG